MNLFALFILLGLFLAISAIVPENDLKSEKVNGKMQLKDCDILYSCSSGMYYCPDSGYMTLTTNWFPSTYNPSRCANEANQISFDIVVSTGYHWKNVTMNGPQYGSASISLNCNTGQKYYQYVTNQKNTDWDCSVTLNW